MQVLPLILSESDDLAGSEARNKLLPGFSFSFQDLCREGLSRFSAEFTYSLVWHRCHAWLWYRCWAVVRISGAWPVCLFEGAGLPLTLPCCPGCGQAQVTVSHALAECSATLCILEDATTAVRLPDTGTGQRFIRFLLTDHADNGITFACQKVLGTCFQLLLGG